MDLNVPHFGFFLIYKRNLASDGAKWRLMTTNGNGGANGNDRTHLEVQNVYLLTPRVFELFDKGDSNNPSLPSFRPLSTLQKPR